jgi:AcrR family transcriptional regulator
LSLGERDRILQAMTECCAEHGYAETTIEHVLTRAAVDQRSFDALFATKEDCAVAAITRVASKILGAAASSERGAGETTPFAGLRAILELLAERPAYARFGYIEARQGGTVRMRETYEAGTRALGALVEQLGESAPESEGSSPQRARAAVGGAEALLRREVAAGRAERLPELLSVFAYGMLVMFVGPEQAAIQARAVARDAGR